MQPEQITAAASAAHFAEAEALAAPFFDSLGEVTPVGCADLPPDYQTLLAHSAHMTVTLEAWHESLVDVTVLAETTAAESYARHSLLSRQSDGRVVQSGVMRINLVGLPDDVRERIAEGGCPLGRILIRTNLLREVELLALWRIAPAALLSEELSVPPGEVIYGRTARILVESRPAVELLEIVRP